MTEETGDVRFGRSAFGGFNRRDVMEYIDRLQRACAAKSGDPDARTQKEMDALARENRRLREENALLLARLREAETANAPSGGGQQETLAEDMFSATAETVSDPEEKGLSMRDVDEMVQKYFG